MTYEEAVHASDEGALIDVDVVPGAKADAFPSGYNPWRKRVEARVAAQATEGRANQALVEVVARFFEIPARRVRVVGGTTSRQKRILVGGLTREHVLAKLDE